MSEDQKPDTTEAVKIALMPYLRPVSPEATPGMLSEASAEAIRAHNEELKRLGYVTVKPVKISKTDVTELLSRAQRATYPVAELIGDLRSIGLPIEVES